MLNSFELANKNNANSYIVMISVLCSSVVDRGFEPRSGETRL